MPSQKSSRAKTQTLSLRLDPKTRFVLEFLAKLNRQSITTVVENAIRKAGYAGKLAPWEEESKTWSDFWDVKEGVRQMLMLADQDFPSDYEDDELRDFIEMHIEFFSETFTLENPDRINVEILWPNIERYLEKWNETKRNDPWAVGYEMVGDLKTANVDAPEWPRKKKEPPKPKIPRSLKDEIEDEIPF